MILPAEGEFRLDGEAATTRLGAMIGRELRRREAISAFRSAGRRQADAGARPDPGRWPDLD